MEVDYEGTCAQWVNHRQEKIEGAGISNDYEHRNPKNPFVQL